MGIVTTDSVHYTNIANAIRVKLEVDDSIKYKPSEMAEAINRITGGKSFSIDPCTNLILKAGKGYVDIQWTDPEDTYINGNLVAEWKKTIVLRKIGGYSINDTDGEVVIVSTVKNEYKTIPFKDESAEKGVENYYSIFAYAENTISKELSASATPLIGAINYYGTTTALSQARYCLAASSIGNYALFAGGTTGSSKSNKVDTYNQSLTKGTASSLSSARSWLSSTTVGNYALFAGGYNSSDEFSDEVETYNQSLTRGAAPALSVARAELASTKVGNYALFAGGLGANGSGIVHKTTVDAYDNSLTKKTCSSLSNMSYEGGATTLNNYALIHVSDSGGIDVYNTSLTRLNTVKITNGDRSATGATSVGEYALFAGGDTMSQTVNVIDSSLTEHSVLNLSFYSARMGAITLDEFAIFAGGSYDWSGQSSIVNSFDTSLTRKVETSLSQARGTLGAAKIGNYALFGGGDTENSGCSNAVDVFELN